MTVSADDCPDKAQHTPRPTGYIAFATIAAERTRAGQRQVRCSTCGFFVVWVGGREIPDWPRLAVKEDSEPVERLG